MELNAFINYEKNLIEEFQAYWIKHNAENPDQFPLSLSYPGWLEQMEGWLRSSDCKIEAPYET